MSWIAKQISRRRSEKTLYLSIYDTGGISESNDEMSDSSDGRILATPLHWALIVSPTIQDASAPGDKYHVVKSCENGKEEWVFEHQCIPNVGNEFNLIVRIALAEVLDQKRLVKYLCRTLMRNEEREWCSHSWICDSFHLISNSRHHRVTCLRQKIKPWYQVKQAGLTEAYRILSEDRLNNIDDETPRPAAPVINVVNYSRRRRRLAYREKHGLMSSVEQRDDCCDSTVSGVGETLSRHARVIRDRGWNNAASSSSALMT